MSTAALTEIQALGSQHFDWKLMNQNLDQHGFALLPKMLTRAQCAELVDMYAIQDLYRSRIVMQRHGFGRGEYQYFKYPLPGLIAQIRQQLFPHLSLIANRWNRLLGSDVEFPKSLNEFLERCHAAGQLRPTPLILKYKEGDFNCLHQDLYGENVFPLQVAMLLSRPGIDFTGGEFVLTEGSPSGRYAQVVSLRQGDAVVFAVNHRPVMGVRSYRKVAMRHGVSQIQSGSRFTAGVIFHDAD